jgi:hypothetical protein
VLAARLLKALSLTLLGAQECNQERPAMSLNSLLVGAWVFCSYTFNRIHPLISINDVLFRLHTFSISLHLQKHVTVCLHSFSLSSTKMPNNKSQRKGQAAKKSGSVAGINDVLWMVCRNAVLYPSDANVMKVQAATAAGADVNHLREGLSCLMLAAVKGCNKIAELWLLVPTRKRQIRKATRR